MTEAVRARAERVLRVLPEWLALETHQVQLQAPENGHLHWVGKAEPKFLTGKATSDWPLAGALILNDLLDDAAPGQAPRERHPPKESHSHWRQWLRLSNLLQGLSGVALLTESMIHAGQTLAVAVPRTVASAAAPDPAGWGKVLEEAEFLARLRPGFERLSERGVAAPDAIGAEVQDCDDYRVAEALWETARLVFLTPTQMECAASWQQAGFAVIEEAGDWWLAVESALNL